MPLANNNMGNNKTNKNCLWAKHHKKKGSQKLFGYPLTSKNAFT